jgi:hypothetical protein
MKLNGIKVVGKEFAYDGCHKIYIIEDENDLKDALECGYDILPISELLTQYNRSCELRFISNWKLTIRYVGQFEKLNIEY